MNSEKEPFVVFLNGTSSAGKTSIAQEFQKLSDQPVLHIGLDHFFFMLPHSYRGDGKNADQGFQFIQESDRITLQEGPVAKRLNYVMRRSMRALFDQGFSLIIDELLFLEEDLRDYLELFKDKKVFFIGIKPPLEVSEQRERVRGDRAIGLARGLYEVVHQNKMYDLVIDTSEMNPEKSAAKILQYIHAHPDPKAFQSN